MTNPAKTGIRRAQTGEATPRGGTRCLLAGLVRIAGFAYRAARGEDDRPVVSDHPLKSVGAERTSDTDLVEDRDLLAALQPVIEAAWTRIERSGAMGRMATLKVTFGDFKTTTRSRTLLVPVADRRTLAEIGEALLRALLPTEMGIRLLGLTLSGIEWVEDHKPLSDDRQILLEF